MKTNIGKKRVALVIGAVALVGCSEDDPAAGHALLELGGDPGPEVPAGDLDVAETERLVQEALERVNRELELSHERLRALSRRLLEVQEEEPTAIVTPGLGQDLLIVSAPNYGPDSLLIAIAGQPLSVRTHLFSGGRDMVRFQATQTSLDGIRRVLLASGGDRRRVQ